MSKEIEIERKFILSDIPFDVKRDLTPKSVITQFYIEDENEPEKTFRVRATSYMNETTFVRTIKTPIKNSDSIGQYEDEEVISAMDFIGFIQKANKKITKTRSVYYIDGNKWEFDNFTDFDLIMCELEMIAKNDDEIEEVEKKLNNVEIPESIQKVLIKEVTGDIEYSNRAMAITHKK